MPVSARVSIEIVRGSTRTPGAVQRMRDAIGQERVDPGPGGENLALPHPPRGGIAIARGGNVATQLASHLRKCAKARHVISVAAISLSFSAMPREAMIQEQKRSTVHGRLLRATDRPGSASTWKDAGWRQGVKNACEM